LGRWLVDEHRIEAHGGSCVRREGRLPGGVSIADVSGRL
jgi:hypothetical protein